MIAELSWAQRGPHGAVYLVTWEVDGGGLKGNLFTDSTHVTLSLWPDTVYHVQVSIRLSHPLPTATRPPRTSHCESHCTIAGWAWAVGPEALLRTPAQPPAKPTPSSPTPLVWQAAEQSLARAQSYLACINHPITPIQTSLMSAARPAPPLAGVQQVVLLFLECGSPCCCPLLLSNQHDDATDQTRRLWRGVVRLRIEPIHYVVMMVTSEN